MILTNMRMKNIKLVNLHKYPQQVKVRCLILTIILDLNTQLIQKKTRLQN